MLGKGQVTKLGKEHIAADKTKTELFKCKEGALTVVVEPCQFEPLEEQEQVTQQSED